MKRISTQLAPTVFIGSLLIQASALRQATIELSRQEPSKSETSELRDRANHQDVR